MTINSDWLIFWKDYNIILEQLNRAFPYCDPTDVEDPDEEDEDEEYIKDFTLPEKPIKLERLQITKTSSEKSEYDLMLLGK